MLLGTKMGSHGLFRQPSVGQSGWDHAREGQGWDFKGADCRAGLGPRLVSLVRNVRRKRGHPGEQG